MARFEDVTEKSVCKGGYGMGVSCGDYDNDGWRTFRHPDMAASS